MKNTRLAAQLHKGFSLVEMLVVIAVIGVIAAIAIPNIGNINSAAKTAATQRNAQSIVSMYQAGTAAGVSWAGGAVKSAKVADVVAGNSPASGAFVGKSFKVPNLAGTDLTDTYVYIGIDGSNNLFYDKAGAQPAS